ncbi:hypothetical protein [Hasllibacter sp. MH4015]|uniref:hypothetical protein n=1 Tax=Hasllibacter sp. MH4015 TaxID=2854029 RepID=UPI001CD1A44D|nr:hypothetical protein [Hasllibacter sp. MH4015]
MSALFIQRLLASVFLGLGGWVLIFPHVVERLVLAPDHYIGTPASSVILGCFGAQAVLGGIVMWLSRFRPITFLVFGIAGSVPFFIFNYYFVFVVEMFTNWMILDFFGNVAIFALCMLGYVKLKGGEAAA